MKRSHCLAAFIAVLMLAVACSREDPPPPSLALPTLADTELGRECRCVIQGECTVLELSEGRGEVRNFQCAWEDRASGRASCTYQSRTLFDDPGKQDLPWSDVTVRFRHSRESGWCWFERSDFSM